MAVVLPPFGMQMVTGWVWPATRYWKYMAANGSATAERQSHRRAPSSPEVSQDMGLKGVAAV
jgi:hypothetical protein